MTVGLITLASGTKLASQVAFLFDFFERTRGQLEWMEGQVADAAKRAEAAIAEAGKGER